MSFFEETFYTFDIRYPAANKVHFNGQCEPPGPVRKVAVLVPAYNVERYLGACLDSLLAQTLPVDVFCCDDGSSDGTRSVLEAYAARSPRIRFVTQANAGVCAARNRLLDELPPEYDAFAFVDGDDMVHPEAYERLAAALAEHEADLAECTIVDVTHDATTPAAVGSGDPLVLDDMSVYLLKATAPGRWINVVTKLMRRASLGHLRFRAGLAHEDDYYYSFEAHQAIRRKVILPQAYYSYRMNPASVTHRLNFAKYVSSCCERIRLSQVEFLNAGRIPASLVPAFRRELAKDAYRMCIRKNLKKNPDKMQRRELFTKAGTFLSGLGRTSGFRPAGLNLLQRLVFRACLGNHYLIGKILVALT